MCEYCRYDFFVRSNLILFILWIETIHIYLFVVSIYRALFLTANVLCAYFENQQKYWNLYFNMNQLFFYFARWYLNWKPEKYFGLFALRLYLYLVFSSLRFRRFFFFFYFFVAVLRTSVCVDVRWVNTLIFIYLCVCVSVEIRQCFECFPYSNFLLLSVLCFL